MIQGIVNDRHEAIVRHPVNVGVWVTKAQEGMARSSFLM